LGIILWSWRESNPRPDEENICFLHAYSNIDFRHLADVRQPTICLSTYISEYRHRRSIPILAFITPLDQSPQDRDIERCLASTPSVKLAYHSIRMIKRQERS